MKSTFHYLLARYWFNRLRDLTHVTEHTPVLAEVLRQIDTRCMWHFSQLDETYVKRFNAWLERSYEGLEALRFPEQTVVIAEHQPEFRPLPAARVMCEESDVNGVVFCWGLTLRQRIKLLFTGKVWHYVNTGGPPDRISLQPTSLFTKRPDYVKPQAPAPDGK